MLTDLNNSQEINNNFSNFDVAVIGAGAAGITIAKKIAFKGKKVALIEAGGYDYSEESQKIYSAKTIGDYYYDLDVARLRYFGGTTNHWGGMCRPFEEEDFNREYLDQAFKWPINNQDINFYLKEACEILEIPFVFYDETLKNSNIKRINFQFSDPPVRFNEKYFDELVKNPLIHVFLNSNLVDLNFNSDEISGAKIKSYTDKNATINAKKFVFALGGIENSRYLLWFRKKYGKRFMSDTQSLGRYWMEHPHFVLGRIILNKLKVKETYLTLTAEAQKKHNILNCGFRIELNTVSDVKTMIREILCLAPKLGKSLLNLANKNLMCGGRFLAAWEQAPNYENCITLDTNLLDRFGIPKPVLNWRKREIDRKTLMKSIEELNNWLLSINGGRVQIDEWLINNKDYPNYDEVAGYHHMGGTRMHKNVRYGVVDAKCKVYGSNNLYMAGSSVFTTGGHNNPTLPIIQLALRLANHLST